jgi:hypothetical protein
MTKRIVALMLALGCIGIGCDRADPAAPGRPIVYHPDKSIASRLLPDDTEVFVHYPKGGPPPLRVPYPKNLAEEIEGLRHSEVIAVVRVTSVQGELVEQGAWVRTKISANVEKLLKASPERVIQGSIETGFRAGTTQIGDVVVNAGISPHYVAGERYLMFLYWATRSQQVAGLVRSSSQRARPARTNDDECEYRAQVL